MTTVTLNETRQPRDIIVVGGSAGALSAALEMLEAIPRDLPATLAVVIHRGAPSNGGGLREVLARRSALPVVEPRGDEPARSATVYVAPADRHLLLDEGHVRLSRGPREHRFRPAVDPLFRSASHAYGARAVGVVLSGGGADGVLGLMAIKARGGMCLAQSPDEASVRMMPVNAIRKDHVDAIVTSIELAAILPALARGDAFTCHATPPDAVRDMYGSVLDR
jgi:two-component system chemotaxis response regulator CheB